MAELIKGIFLVDLVLLCVAVLPFPPVLVSAAGSCPTPLCPGSRQVVAVCSVNDTTNASNTLWGGDSIDDCGGPFIALAHVQGINVIMPCAGTTFEASIVSVEGSVFTSELTLIPTSSNNGERVFCALTTAANMIQECTLNVLSVGVMGVIEQRRLSEVFVSVTLMDESGSVCVDEYFSIFNGNRVNSSNSRVGSFPVDLCTTPKISDLIVGTSRNGSDDPTTTVGVFTADTTNLYSSELAVSHSYNASGVTLDLSWTAVDETVMSESEVMMSCSCESCSSSCMNSSEMSDSVTSHRLQLSYNEFSLGRVSVSVSFQSGSCSDVETRVYEVTNFGTATVSPGEETVILSFDESLLASGVNVARIRGNCEDGSQEMFWDYPLTSIAFNAIRSCPNGSHIFQALTSGNMAVGFPFPVYINFTESPATTGADAVAAAVGSAVCGIIVGIVVIIFAVLVILHLKKNNKVRNTDHESQGENQPDSMYADPNTIEHKKVPNTGVEYAVVDVKTKEKKKERKEKAQLQAPPPTGDSLYANPDSIEHKKGPDNEAEYAVVDKKTKMIKKKKNEGGPQQECGSVPVSGALNDPANKSKSGLAEQRQPDVVSGSITAREKELNYIDVDVSTRSGSDRPVMQTMNPTPVDYADITLQAQ